MQPLGRDAGQPRDERLCAVDSSAGEQIRQLGFRVGPFFKDLQIAQDLLAMDVEHGRDEIVGLSRQQRVRFQLDADRGIECEVQLLRLQAEQSQSERLRLGVAAHHHR